MLPAWDDGGCGGGCRVGWSRLAQPHCRPPTPSGGSSSLGASMCECGELLWVFGAHRGPPFKPVRRRSSECQEETQCSTRLLTEDCNTSRCLALMPCFFRCLPTAFHVTVQMALSVVKRRGSSSLVEPSTPLRGAVQVLCEKCLAKHAKRPLHQ